MKKKFKDISWSATIQVNFVRSFIAGILWTIFMMINSSSSIESNLSMLLLPIMLPVVLIPATVIGNALWQMGVPFAGWIGIISSFLVFIADPIVFAIHKINPRIVPVQNYSFLHFNLWFIVYHDNMISLVENNYEYFMDLDTGDLIHRDQLKFERDQGENVTIKGETYKIIKLNKDEDGDIHYSVLQI
ncbi:hypothetical protein KKB55_04065 [Myxococcota bacterium]|nr:hypothetical protein [Myxococcota bacterium]MBU1896926.1 hypothetical protein [Myxococcota bacterium]